MKSVHEIHSDLPLKFDLAMSQNISKLHLYYKSNKLEYTTIKLIKCPNNKSSTLLAMTLLKQY
jgi:hypothetical protein